jgi:hypothetical protein
MIHVPTDPGQVNTDLPSIAIDLSGAYTPDKRGTGFAISCRGDLPAASDDLTQTDALKVTVSHFQQLRQAGETSTNLILEAPLSWAFASSDLFLDARLREIEKPSSYPALDLQPNQVRPWNSNAGASTSLMALLFLKALDPQIPRGLTVNLFEGFWSWKRKPKRHGEVAEDLLEGLQAGGNRVVSLPKSSISYRTVLKLLNIRAQNQDRPPLIIFGYKELAIAYRPASS